MNTFQALVYSAVHGIAEFLPISATAHDRLVSYFFGWPSVDGPLLGALSLGSLLSLLVYFRHDWASIISCFLQVILFRKKPMTLDERLPLFLTLTTLPTAIAWYYLHGTIEQQDWSPLLVAAVLGGWSIPLWLTEAMSRRNKGMFDWNWFDSIVVGISQIAMLVPGAGRTAAAFPGAFIRNYNREAAAKYIFFAALPFLAGAAFLHLREGQLHAAIQAGDLSWLTFIVATIATFLAGLLAIGGFMKHIQRRGLGQYVIYRLLLAGATAGVYWYRNR